MKKLSLFLSFTLFALSVFAQGNLQFNQVIYQEITFTQAATATNPQTQTTFTVPSGKVWKIESAFTASNQYQSSSSPAGAYGFYTADCYLAINGRIVYSAVQSVQTHFPIWLPTGTYTLTLGRTGIVTPNASNPTTWNGSISAIEFNVIP